VKQSKKRKKSRFLDFQKNVKKRKKGKSNNMYCRPKILDLNITIRFVVLYASTNAIYIINIHCFRAVLEIPYSEKSAKSETSNFGLRFLRFFEMPLQKT